MRKQIAKEYRGYRNAGIRMSEELAPEFLHGREADERDALYASHMYDKAHCVMLAERGILPREVGRALVRGLRDMESEEGGAVGARVRVGGGMHSGEYYLIRELGEEVGGWDHAGRSSACLAAVGRRIQQRDQLLALMEGLNQFRGTLLSQAGKHLDAVIPGYFKSQLTQPTTLGHYLLGYAQGFGRDAARAREAWSRINLNPGGGVVLTGTAFDIDRARVADLLGFDGVVINAADAIAGNDTAIEGFAILAILANSISRLNRDLDRWAATENGFVSVADRYCAGSSLAMNMKTPLFPGFGADTNAIGDLVKSFSPAGTLGGLNPDASFKAMAGLLRLFAQILDTLSIDKARARAVAAGPGYAGGTDLAAVIVKERQLPWRTAHQICGILFRLSSDRRLAPQEISGAMLDEAAIEYFGEPLGLSTEVIQHAMEPETIIASRTHEGGAAPGPAKQSLEQLAKELASDEDWVRERKASLEASAGRLESAMNEILSA